jgi:hypothetical protein
VGRSFRDLELPVVDAVANVPSNASGIDFVSIDLSTCELRDEHRGIHRALLRVKSQNSSKKPLFTVSVLPMVYFSSAAGLVLFETFFPLPLSLSFAAAFFASSGFFFIAIILCSQWTHRGRKTILSRQETL